MIATALTIAGSDSSGGAGIQADIKTFSSLGVYASSAITALTAQNTVGVQGVYEISAEFVGEQIKSVCSDLTIKATKLGMLANAEIVTQVCKSIDDFSLNPVVLDPVMVAQSGDRLLSEAAVNSIKQELIPRATIITPNLHEAAVLLECSITEVMANIDRALEKLMALGCGAVLLKGGHAHDPDPDQEPADETDPPNNTTQNTGAKEVIDYFATTAVDRLDEGASDARNLDITLYKKKLLPTTNTHGSGCTLAAAITAYLALGMELKVAVAEANKFIDGAIKAADSLQLGNGSGPVHHCHQWWN